jgi:hypothetical protein
MFKFFQRLFGQRRQPPHPAPVPGRPSRQAHGPAATRKAPASAAAAVEEATIRTPVDPGAPPEVLCGLSPGMSTEEIRDHLALLYRRHNRAASSLDEALRADAEIMLDAIVRCRETFLGVPGTTPPTSDSVAP